MAITAKTDMNKAFLMATPQIICLPAIDGTEIPQPWQEILPFHLPSFG
jgi:hypothetical protein